MNLRSFLFLSFVGFGFFSCTEKAPDDDEKPAEKKPDSETCKTDSECTEAGKAHCDGFAGCVPCVLDAHCGDGQRCVEHSCEDPRVCSTSADCSDPATSVCNLILGECAECVTSSDCADAEICDEGTCSAITPCVNSLDCNDGTVCDREAGYCVECLADADCPETDTCVERACIPRCSSDKDCTTAGELCDKSAGFCVECVENVDCPELYHCSGGSCLVDVCLTGQEQCSPDGLGFERCNAAGSGTNLVPCVAGSSCAQEGTESYCDPWVCQPGLTACSADGKRLETCDEDGLGSTTAIDCSATDGRCENGGCVDVVCSPNERFCSGDSLLQCSATGTSYELVSGCNPTTHFCSDEDQDCRLHVCVPGQQTCDGNSVVTCKDDGSGFGSEEADCGDDDRACYLGQCLDIVCEVGEVVCDEGANRALSCIQNGTQTSVADYCSASEYCEDGSCVAYDCTPGQAICSGETAGTCGSDGLGIDDEQATEDCSSNDQACWEGSCEEKICEPGLRFCRDGNVHQCLANGTSSSLWSNCLSNQYCEGGDDENATCKTQVCSPNAAICDGDRATTCNDLGSGYESGGTVCEDDEVCVTGSCLPVICEANAYFCDDEGNVDRCGADGTTVQQVDTCSASEHCIEGNSSCRSDVCPQGDPVCTEDGLLATCSADGSGPLDDGVACDSGEACEDGACLDVICTPGDETCDGNLIRVCNATGTQFDSSTTCSSSYYCDMAAPGDAECFVDMCVPAEPTCRGETVAVCSSSGGPTESLGTDCSATDMLCDGTSCVAEVVESVGGTTSSSSSCNGYRIGNRYYINKDRNLGQIQHYLGIADTSTIQLTWFVYEGNGTSSTSYTKIFEKLTTASGTGFHSSGVIDVPLEEGHYYMIGVRPGSTCTRYYQTSSSYGYLPSGGYIYRSDYYSDTGALESTWSASVDSYRYPQTLTFN